MFTTLSWLAILSSALSHALLIHSRWRPFRQRLTSRCGASTVHKQEHQVVGPSVDSVLSFYQEKAAEVVSSFCPVEFGPVSWLSNQQSQTCVGFFIRYLPECAYISNGYIVATLRAVSCKVKTNERLKKIIATKIQGWEKANYYSRRWLVSWGI